MKYCTRCGKEMPDEMRYCPECGTRVFGFDEQPMPQAPARPARQGTDDTGGVLWGLLGYVITLFTLLGGVILCVVFLATDKPRNACATAIGMVVAFVTYIAIYVIFYAWLFTTAS